MYKRKLSFYLASKADFPMTVLWEKRQKNTVNLHTHDYIELVCVSGGSATHRLQGENFPIRRGSIFIIPREVSHGYDVHEDENLSLYNILYQPENLPFDQLDLTGRHSSLPRSEQGWHSAKQLPMSEKCTKFSSLHNYFFGGVQ